MYKVLKTESKEYIVFVNDKPFYASTDDKVISIMKELGSNDDEIEYGLTEMIKNDHNMCEYGINKMFIFSKKVA